MSACTGTHTNWCAYTDTSAQRGHKAFSVLSAKHTMHIISNNSVLLTYKSLITCSTPFYESYPDPVCCATSTFIFPRTK